jgi:hypothetical protein
MSRVLGAAKLILGNAVVLLALIAALNLLAAIILDVQDGVGRLRPGRDGRASLPNYAGDAEAGLIFEEFGALETEYQPYVVWSRRPFSGRLTTVNAEGDRVHAETTASPEGVVRFIGGSSTWGSGADDEGTLPARFNALYPNLKVHNHGESGFHSRPEVARLVHLVNQRAPMDLVVFYDGANDTEKLCRAEVGLNGSTRTSKIRRRVHPVSETVSALTSSLLEVINGGFFRRHVFKTGQRLTRCEQDPEYTARIAETLLENWRIAKAISAAGGADFIAILQPVASVHSPRVDHLDPRDVASKSAGLVYDHVRRLVAADPAIDWFYDLSDAYDGDAYIFIDDVHVSENGNEIMAAGIKTIADPILVRRGLVDPAGP